MTAIEPGQCINEALEPGDEMLQDDTFIDEYILDWPGGNLRITLDSNDFDEFLSVFDPDGTRTNVDASASDTETFFRPNAPSGMYTIWANSFFPDVGDYQICVFACNLPPVPEAPQPADGATGIPTDVTLSWSGKNRPKVIYGADDRLDIFEIADPALLEAADSVGVLMDPSLLTDNGDGTSTLSTVTFSEDIDNRFGSPLCSDEPFRDQPAPGFCSGFLAAPDLFVTAGHCVNSGGECSNTAVVFDFFMEDENTPRTVFPNSDIYFCAEIVAREFTFSDEDWAVIRLDRPVVGHQPLAIRRDGQIPDNADLIIIGHPSGIPQKVAGGASVRSNDESDFFVANLDSYQSNSGSPVFNADTLIVEGILVRGENDFVMEGECFVSMRCGDDECRGEDSTRTTIFAQHIPPLTVGSEFTVRFGLCGSLETLGMTSDNMWPLSGLSPGTTYCWRILSENPCGMTEGPVWSFTTAAAPTPRPTASDPRADVDGSMDVGISDLFVVARDWLELFGRKGEATSDPNSDIDVNGRVGPEDILILLENWKHIVEGR